MQDFKNLKVWKEAHDFSINIYKTTSRFPSNEQFGITSQLRRASTSIAANIAEGTGRQSNAAFLAFLYNSIGSSKECENFLLVSKDLGYLSDESYNELNESCVRISKMLNSLIQSVKKSKTTS
jgi:four helix bundle protein